MIARLAVKEWDMIKTLKEIRVQEEKTYLGAQNMISKIMEAQDHNQEVVFIETRLELGEPVPNWSIHSNGKLRYQGRLFVLNSYLKKEYSRNFITQHLRYIQEGLKCTTI
ncbi:hypothetical protein ACSBR2_019871 [Camellia fascicularis]